MTTIKSKTEQKFLLWKSVAIIASAFAFIICVLTIVNFFQLKKADPVKTEVINSLVERLNQNPKDAELRNQIREFDLLARKAYFTTQWQVRTGGYLLLISLLIVIISVQIIDSLSKKIPVVIPVKNDKLSVIQKNARKWISIGGLLLAGITLLFAFLSHRELKNKFSNENVAKSVMQHDSIASEDADKNKINTVVKDSTVKSVDSAALQTTALFSSAETRTNFPSFRGYGSNGIAYQTRIPTSWDGASKKNILWKVTIPLKGFNSPILWTDKLFVTGAGNGKQQVYCYDRNTGKLLWTANATGIKGSPAVSPKVAEDTGLAAPTTATDGTTVVAIFATGDIVAINFSGKILWAKNLGVPDNHYGHSSSLIIYNENVIVQYDNKGAAKVMALSTKTGDVVWSKSRKVKVSWSSPILVNTGIRDEVILTADPYVASYNPETGAELWKIDATYGEVGPSLAYANGIVFVMNDYAKLVAIKIGSTPKILWEDNEFLSDVPSPVATDKYVFIPTSYGVIACYEAKTGKALWNHDFSTGVYASPILAEGKIYLLDRKGVMHIFKADKEFTLIAESALGEKSDCTPAFANGRIYIRARNSLYCVGGK